MQYVELLSGFLELDWNDGLYSQWKCWIYMTVEGLNKINDSKETSS